MAFMVPEYYFGKMWLCEDCNSDQCLFPWDQFTRQEAEQMCSGPVELTGEGWWFRLSAPGYMDATEWNGPEPTEEAARGELFNVYNVHPDTGDEVPEDIPEEDLEHLLNEQVLTHRLPDVRQNIDRVMRKRLKQGVAPADGGDYYYDEPQRAQIKRPKTEKERMMDFFFGKKRGSFLSLKSWGK